MALPASDLTNNNTNASSDDPSQARSELDACILKVNTLIDAITTTGANNGLKLDGSGNISSGVNFAAGVGFNGDTADANLLDDYEEGTWTPVLSDGTNNATMVSTNNYYEKIGRQISFSGAIETSSLGSVSGSLRVTGLPYTSKLNDRACVTCGHAFLVSITAGETITGWVQSSSSYIVLTLWDASTGTTTLQSGEWTGSGGTIYISGTYRV